MAGGLDAAMKAAMASTEPTVVPFKDGTLRVLPPMKWRQSAMDAIHTGQYNKWARGAMVEDDAALFVAADLTNEDVVAFFNAYAEVAGQSPGE